MKQSFFFTGILWLTIGVMPSLHAMGGWNQKIFREGRPRYPIATSLWYS